MAGGTILAGEQALIDGICVHLGGGFHHAHQSHASGFCLLNDIAIGLRVLLDRGMIHSAAVIDCDLHQGDATARIFRDDPRVFTLSLHQQDAFPYYKQRSSLDIELPAGTGDEKYLAALDETLADLFANGRQFDFLHYQAGVDTYANDQLGRLQLSEEGLRERDRRIVTTASARGIPLVVTLGGGYTTDPAEVARLHANTVVEASKAYWQRSEKKEPGFET
jgi:acetoin utilization deacetylase AcuC-like enzyme